MSYDPDLSPYDPYDPYGERDHPYGYQSAYGGQQPGAYPPAAYQPAAQPYPVHSPTNGYAVASLICGIGVFMVGVTFIPAIICGHIARAQIKRTGQDGDGLALAGLILGYIGLVSVVAIVAFVVIMMVAVAGSASYY